MSRRANGAGVVGRGRVLGMRVGGLYCPHDAYQDNAEHAYGSEERSPTCACAGQVLSTAPSHEKWLLNDSTLIFISDVGILIRRGHIQPNDASDLDILSHS
jgi:hypothetical protein